MEIEISGIEKQKVLEKLSKCFNYNGDYWIPLKNLPIDKDYFVMSDEEAFKYHKEIEDFLKVKSQSFYLTGEAGYIEPSSIWLQETDYLDFNYGPVEFVYFDKNFEWLIYISHENTITFCGAELVKFVKDNLK